MISILRSIFDIKANGLITQLSACEIREQFWLSFTAGEWLTVYTCVSKLTVLWFKQGDCFRQHHQNFTSEMKH